MNSRASATPPDQRRLVWCAVFASLFKFETRCDAKFASSAAAAAFERYAALDPHVAVESTIHGELTWPVAANTVPPGD